jgi:preprotein translocase subunit SecG
MFWLVFIVWAILSVVLTAIILLQEPKQAGLGDALTGGGGGDFSSSGGTAGGLHRLTIYVGVAWGALSLILGVMPR